MADEMPVKPSWEREPAEFTLEELARMMGVRSELPARRIAEGEITLRQIRAQLEATEAQKAAAKAEEKAAEASEQSAKAARFNGWLMLASVMIALISAIGAACSAYFSYLSIVHPLGK